MPFDEMAEPRAVIVAPWGDLIITENDYSVIRILRRKHSIFSTTMAATGTLTVTVPSMPAQAYAMDVADDLVRKNWQAVTVATGTTGDIVTTISDTNAFSRTNAFYRIHTTLY